MTERTRLDDFPGLASWYREQVARAHSDRPSAADQLVLDACRTLHHGDAMEWSDALLAFLARSAKPLDDFLVAQDIVNRCEAELLNVLGELCQLAVKEGHGARLVEALRASADAIGIVTLRFLTAWTALNTGQLEICIEECDRVDQPFAPLYTIQGQALLELGRAAEAVEALDVATALAPHEILAWFQKAKAHHVLGRTPEAVKALEECRRLSPQSEEVMLFLAMLAGGEEATQETRERVWTSLRPQFSRVAQCPSLALAILKLSCRLGDKARALEVLEASSSGDWPSFAKRPDLMQDLAVILRIFHQTGWMDVAATLLTRLVPGESPAA